MISHHNQADHLRKKSPDLSMIKTLVMIDRLMDQIHMILIQMVLTISHQSRKENHTLLVLQDEQTVFLLHLLQGTCHHQCIDQADAQLKSKAVVMRLHVNPHH